MLKDLRKSLDLSINELADLIDVAPRTIRRWEEGSVDTPITVMILLKLVKHEYIGTDDIIWARGY